MINTPQKAQILQELGAKRPDSEDDNLIRTADIMISRRTKFDIIRKRFAHLSKEDAAREIEKAFQQYPDIVASGKEISEWLELEYLIAARIMYEGISQDEAMAKAHEILHFRQKPRELGAHLINLGLEIELGKPRKGITSDEQLLAYTHDVDALQEIGIMIDGDALREVKLSKSHGTYDQIRAGYELERLGIITEDQTVGVQFNISGILHPERIYGELVLLHLMFSSTDHFGASRIPLGKSINLPEHSQKSTHERKEPEKSFTWSMPSSFPIRIKTGDVVEFRGIFKKWQGSLGFAKSTTTFGVVVDSLAAYSLEFDKNIPEESMSAEAKIWVRLRNEFLASVTSLAKEKDIKTLSNLHAYLESIRFYRHVNERFKAYRGKIDEAEADEPEVMKRLQSEPYQQASKIYEDMVRDILAFSKDDDEFWLEYEEKSLEFMPVSSGEAKKLQISILRDLVRSGKEYTLPLGDRTFLQITFFQLWNKRYKNFGSLWSDAIAISKFDDYRDEITEAMIKARAEYRNLTTTKVEQTK